MPTSPRIKDRAALGKLVVAQNFFWVQDKDLADKSKPGIDNLAKAVDLGAKDGSGWEVLAGFANEPTAAESQQQKGVYCAPADPTIDSTAFEGSSQGDPDRSVRMGLSEQGWRRSACNGRGLKRR